MSDDSFGDIYFQESTLDVRELFGVDSARWTRHTALLLLTPDTVVSRQAPAVMSLVTAAGFEPVATAPVHIDRVVCREIWRRELASPDPETLDRLAVCDLLFPYTATIAVLLTDRAPRSGLPASTRLSELKGSGEPALRRPGTLRRELHSPNNVFRLVHASDGPNELVRELGILLDRPQRRALLRDAREEAADAATVTALARAAYEPVGERSLVTEPAIRRLLASVDEATGGSSLAGLRDPLERLSGGHPIDFRSFLASVAESGLDMATWDLIAVGAQSLACRPPHG